MNYSAQGRWTKLVLLLFLIFFVIILLFLPWGLSFLTIPEQLFILSFLVFFILYSKVLAGFYFVIRLLGMIENEEDIFEYLKGNLSKNSLYKFLIEGDLLMLVETQLLKVKEKSSTLFDMTLLFLFVMFILQIINIIPDVVFYSVVLPAIIVIVFAWFVEIYASWKFTRIFLEEIAEFYAVMRELNKRNEEESYNEEGDLEVNKEEISKKDNNVNESNKNT